MRIASQLGTIFLHKYVPRFIACFIFTQLHKNLFDLLTENIKMRLKIFKKGVNVSKQNVEAFRWIHIYLQRKQSVFDPEIKREFIGTTAWADCDTRSSIKWEPTRTCTRPKNCSRLQSNFPYVQIFPYLEALNITGREYFQNVSEKLWSSSQKNLVFVKITQIFLPSHNCTIKQIKMNTLEYLYTSWP